MAGKCHVLSSRRCASCQRPLKQTLVDRVDPKGQRNTLRCAECGKKHRKMRKERRHKKHEAARQQN